MPSSCPLANKTPLNHKGIKTDFRTWLHNAMVQKQMFQRGCLREELKRKIEQLAGVADGVGAKSEGSSATIKVKV